MLHLLNADAGCAKCGKLIRGGTLVSWISPSDRSALSGPHHLDCSPLQVDRDQAKAEEAAGFSRQELKAPQRKQPILVDRSDAETTVRKTKLPELSYQFRAELGNNDRTLTLVLVSVACTLLVVAITLERLPVDFYTVLRFSVSGTFALLVKQLWECPEKYWRVIFIGLVVLYNPLIPIHFSKDFWESINILTLPLLLVGQYIKYYYKEQTKSEA